MAILSIFATLWEGLLNGISNVWSLAIIVIPIIIVLEIAKDNSILDKWSHKLHPPLKHLGLSENAVFPILVAFIFGLIVLITGLVVIQTNRKRRQARRNRGRR